MAQLFGKNYLEAGKSTSPLLLRSNGEIKLLWGNKFIDLIKNGKLNTSQLSFINLVNTKDDIQDNGIYLVTEDESIWISIEGKSILISETENSYISFLTKLELTTEQKDIALTNIGFYYDTLDQVNLALILAGLVYVKDTNKIYLIKEGNISEYSIAIPTNFESLVITNLTTTSINGTLLVLSINNLPYILLSNTNILCSYPIIVDTVKSLNYEYNKLGFSIELNSGKYILDIDSINWRNIDSEFNVTKKDYIKYTTLGEFNVATSAIQLDDLYYLLNLKYPNSFKIGDYILMELDTTYNVFTLYEYLDNDSLYFTLDKSIPEGNTLVVEFEDGASLEYTESLTKYTYTGTIKSAKLANGFYYVDINNSTKHSIIPVEFEITDINTLSINIKVLNNEMSSDLLNIKLTKIYLSRVSQFIQGEGFIALRKWENDKYVYHTIMGLYSESEFGISEDDTLKFGLYSDDIKVTGISLSGAKFSGSLPEYVEQEPNNVLDSQIPTMGIVNKAIEDSSKTNISLISKSSLPKGSIIMFNGTSIPDDWAICNGENGTPNLIDKFIKAGNELKESTVSITEGDSTISAYSLMFIMKMK